ncbi:MAG: TonB-dependent receptor [Bacteroidales bacterium]|nr:TonB-dependent receptor [Bacteroidales bacterium]
MKSLAKKIFLALFCLGTGVSLFAQNTVKGVVRDEAGEPLIGASVTVEGTSIVTITGIDGDYVISVPADAVNLAFSFIGLKDQVVPIEGRSEIDVVLLQDSTFLDEVVVVGYATVKRRDLLGSVSSVGSEKLAEMPVAAVSEALTGKMAGVSVVTTEGDPDADIKIRVRGGSSITQNNSPLYIVDGFPVESINDIASSEIASIDVLKDAFSTAIYGSRGANGVVIVTTKNAEKDRKVSIQLNAYYGMKKMANRNAIKVMDVENYAKLQYEQYAISKELPNKYEPYFGKFSEMDQYEGMEGNDWLDAVFGRTGDTFSADLTISGAGERYSWSLGYAHLGETAIMKGSSFMRDNLKFKANFKTSKNISIDANVRYSRVNIRGAGANSINDSGTTAGQGRLKHAIQFQPIPVTSIGGDDDDESMASYKVSPLKSVEDNDSRRLRTTLNVNAAFNWTIIKNLKLKIEGGLEDYRQSDDRFYGTSTYYSVSNSKVLGTPSNQHKENFRTRFRNTNTLNYDFKKLLKNDDHQLTALIGEELTITKSNTINMMVDGFPVFFNSELAWNFMSSASGKSLGADGVTNNASLSNNYAANDNMLSFFTRVNYEYKHRYSIGATFRADASSKFSNPWGFFPSAAVSWTISQEPFMFAARNWLDQLKLRYSFGTAGNNNIPGGMLSKEYASSSTTYISTGGSYWAPKTDENGKATMNNPDLKWETTYTHNIGLDFGFFNGRLSGSIEVYQNDTKDLLINFPISGAGYNTQYRNAGSTRNRGIEISLNAPVITTRDFSLNLAANVAFNKNVVTDLGGLDVYNSSSYWASKDIQDDYRVEKGQPLGNMYGYVSDGFYTTDDFVGYVDGKWVLKEGVANSSPVIGENYLMPGAMKLKNIDGSADNMVTASDRKVIGNAMADVTGGFSLSAFWKGIDLSMNFNYMIGNDVYNANKIEFNTVHNNYYFNLTRDMEVGKRWTIIDWSNGEVMTDLAKIAEANSGKKMWNPVMGNAVFSDWAVEDASFLRLQSATIGYTLPEALTSRIHLRKVRVYVTGTNLFCLTKYSGYDPEVDTRRTTPLTPGVDYSAYPKSIGVVAGLNLTF